MTKRLSPALRQQAEAVKAAHADLTKNAPGFRKKSGADQIRLAQRHAARLKGRG